MTGPEHYREAERILAEEGERLPDLELVSLAQVHATLALAAATAEAFTPIGRQLWREVTR